MVVGRVEVVFEAWEVEVVGFQEVVEVRCLWNSYLDVSDLANVVETLSMIYSLTQNRSSHCGVHALAMESVKSCMNVDDT